MSKAMKLLQQKCGCKADGSFGPNTARGIVSHYQLTPEEGAHLLGQASHESGNFKYVRENLNYSVKALMATWPSRFPDAESAKPYARNPKALAENVYFGRMGNDTKERAGLYVGRGFIQLTGYKNHRGFASDLGLPQVLTDPSLLETDYAFDAALWFFKTNNLFEMANEGVTDEVIKRITRRVNGGYKGLDDRTFQTHKIYGWLSNV